MTSTGKTPIPIVLTPEERSQLDRWAQGRRTPVRLVRRARIILRAAAGLSHAAIARALRTDRECVGRWRARFAEHRLAGIQREAPRPGRPPKIHAWVLQAIVTRSTTTRPAGADRWSVRRLAREVGVSPTTVHRVWQANGIEPHWVRPFGLRPASQALEQLTEVVGGYLTPWDSALVVCGDATWLLRPTDPGQGEGARRRGSRAHNRGAGDDPARYTAVDLPTGHVIGHSAQLTRHKAWLQFLTRLAARVPRGQWVHVLADNAAIHQHPDVQRWVERHPRIQLHLVPPHRPLPRWVVQALQRWVDAPFLGPQRQTVQSLREAVDALRPRRQRGKEAAAWTGSRSLIRKLTGDPRLHLLPPGMRLEGDRLVPCPPGTAGGPGRVRARR